MQVTPVVLEGQHVRLEPLGFTHAEGLLAASDDPEIWRYLPAVPTTLEAMEHWIEQALAQQAAGTQMPFAILTAGGRAIGSTRYLDIRPQDRGIEIGWTWLARAVWRTAANTECKLLLLQHAFETLGCIRVQLKTDRRNERSQRAIERLGAQYEGVLRHHMIMPDGYYRDSVYYSILDGEWPAVKQRLLAWLER